MILHFLQVQYSGDEIVKKFKLPGYCKLCPLKTSIQYSILIFWTVLLFSMTVLIFWKFDLIKILGISSEKRSFVHRAYKRDKIYEIKITFIHLYFSSFKIIFSSTKITKMYFFFYGKEVWSDMQICDDISAHLFI